MNLLRVVYVHVCIPLNFWKPKQTFMTGRLSSIKVLPHQNERLLVLLTGGIFKLRCWKRLRCRIMRTKFYED
jgi:hypothetical protein